MRRFYFKSQIEMTTEVYLALCFKVSLAYLVSNPLKCYLNKVADRWSVTLLTNKAYCVRLFFTSLLLLVSKPLNVA